MYRGRTVVVLVPWLVATKVIELRFLMLMFHVLFARSCLICKEKLKKFSLSYRIVRSKGFLRCVELVRVAVVVGRSFIGRYYLGIVLNR